MKQPKPSGYGEFERAALAFYASPELRTAPFEEAIQQFETFEAEWVGRASDDPDLTLTVQRTLRPLVLYWYYRHERPAAECDQRFRALQLQDWADLEERFFPVTLHAKYLLRWGWLDDAERELRILAADIIEAVMAGEDPGARRKLAYAEELLALVGIARSRPVTGESIASLKEALGQVVASMDAGDDGVTTAAVQAAAGLAEDLKKDYRDGLSLPRDIVHLITEFLVATHGRRADSKSDGSEDAWGRLLRALTIMS